MGGGTDVFQRAAEEVAIVQMEDGDGDGDGGGTAVVWGLDVTVVESWGGGRGNIRDLLRVRWVRKNERGK